MALPRLGGAPAVWNSAMLVYQALLLGGYAYAHAIARLNPRAQAISHIALLLLAALWLPIGLNASLPSASAEPALWVPWLLTISIGPLFFVVAAQAPLMQRWYSLASGGRDPYALYAASNLGSFGGLLSYPLIVEPQLALAEQSRVWTGGYVLLVGLVAGCALLLLRSAPTSRREESSVVSAPPTGRRWLHWIALAAVPSGLMLSSTTYLTTDIVAMPMLWVVPLALYLLSFSVAFANLRWPADIITRIAPVAILVLGGLTLTSQHIFPLAMAGLVIALLFIVAVALHTQMFRLRPAPDRLTGFYLAMALGGVLGGLFAALIAPVAFDWTYEHPLLILAAAVLVPKRHVSRFIRRLWGRGARARIATLSVALVASTTVLLSLRHVFPKIEQIFDPVGFALLTILGLLSLGRRVAYTIVVIAMLLMQGVWAAGAITLKGDERSRSYFGTYSVRDGAKGATRFITHGTTLHGMQILTPGREREPTTYYAPGSGVGIAVRSAEDFYGPHAQIGVVGLGAGTLACYARPGQDWRFYEIDPEVVRIARWSGKFTFLSRCAPDAAMEIGDARITLAKAPLAGLDLLVLDAFSSDSIPIHLLTREAFGIYGRALGPDGLLLVHISNRYMDLEPAMAAAARSQGWDARVYYFIPSEEARNDLGAGDSQWVAMSRDPEMLGRLASREKADWRPLRARPGFVVWTDDYASILPLLRGTLLGAKH